MNTTKQKRKYHVFTNDRKELMNQYPTRLLDFLVRVKNSLGHDSKVDLSKICKDAHVGALAVTVIKKRGVVVPGQGGYGYVWNDKEYPAVDFKLVEKLGAWINEYASEVRKIRKEKQVVESVSAPQTFDLKFQLEFMQAQLADQSKMLELIISRFGLNGTNKK